MATTLVEESWQDGDVANIHNFRRRRLSLDCGYSLPLHNRNICFIQYTFKLPLEVVDPGGSLLMLLSPRLGGEMPAENPLAGSNGRGGIQLRPDDGGT
jgi:hypothetical protein